MVLVITLGQLAITTPIALAFAIGIVAMIERFRTRSKPNLHATKDETQLIKDEIIDLIREAAVVDADIRNKQMEHAHLTDEIERKLSGISVLSGVRILTSAGMTEIAVRYYILQSHKGKNKSAIVSALNRYFTT